MMMMIIHICAYESVFVYLYYHAHVDSYLSVFARACSPCAMPIRISSPVLNSFYCSNNEELVKLSPDGQLAATWSNEDAFDIRSASSGGTSLVTVRARSKIRILLWNPLVIDSNYGILCGYDNGMVAMVGYSSNLVC
jgi:hypothetical protein